MKKIYLLIALLFIVNLSLFAGSTGKIVGKVKDVKTGKPLAHTTVVIEGTQIGAQTDARGKYIILNVEAGRYNLVCQLMGYQTVKMDSVLVVADETTTANFKLEPASTAIEGMKVTKKKSRKIKKAQTASTAMVGDIQGLVAMKAGAYNSKKGELNVRGGQGNEIQYISDGLSVSEPNKKQKINKNLIKKNAEKHIESNENPFVDANENNVSTFSVDVDRASYTLMRRDIENNYLPNKHSIRTEEYINYFHYNYKQPKKHPIAIDMEVAQCPWNKENKLARIALQAKSLEDEEIKANNLVFLIDVSGSMQGHNKLPLLKKSFKILVDQLDENDFVSIVVYAGASGVVLEPTRGDKKENIIRALDNLRAGGSTAGGAGIKLAYQTAYENFIEDGNNRIILASDGDFNVGIRDVEELKSFIEKKRKTGIFFSVLGFGGYNTRDDIMETLADHGNGQYFYIDGILEADKVFGDELFSTIYTVAKDVKIQIEFNPKKVAEYRLIGYENRLLSKKDFKDDKKDAGDMGAGHSVTALYEIVPAEENYESDNDRYTKTVLKDKANSNELLLCKVRYKKPDGKKSTKIEKVLNDNNKKFKKASQEYKFAAAVAEFSLILQDSKYVKNTSFAQVEKIAKNNKGKDVNGYRSEFVKLVKKARLMNN